MQCVHKDKKGKRCKHKMPGRIKYCFIHDPRKMPIVFIKDFGLYEKNFLESELPVNLAQGYIDIGAAVKVDDRMWVKIMQAVEKGMAEYEKQLAAPLKWWVKKKDIVSILRFFGDTNFISPRWLKGFVRTKMLTEEERIFIRSVVEPFAKGKRNNK